MGIFERYLTLWVGLCILVGVALGNLGPGAFQWIASFEYAHVNLVVALLIWVMIYPMMVQIDFSAVRDVGKKPRGIILTLVVNWLIKPFTMAALGWLFFRVLFVEWVDPQSATEYIAGMILLGVAPCTAMVFVWSYLTRGNPAYTVVQVATNDLIILPAFAPIVALLLGVGGIKVPWDTLFLSVVLFVVIPLVGGVLTRVHVIKTKGLDYFNTAFIPKFSNVTIGGLLLTLVLIFSFQGEIILKNPMHIALIAVPLIIQTYLIFFIAYLAAKKLRLAHDIAAPAGMIGASNFFELSVAVAISLFGTASPVVLATIVGVLVEVPVMLTLVKISNGTTHWFGDGKA